MDEAIVYLVWAEISGVLSVDRGTVCMLCYGDMRGLVVGPISMTLFLGSVLWLVESAVVTRECRGLGSYGIMGYKGRAGSPIYYIHCDSWFGKT